MNSGSAPTLTIAIPCYNGSSTIGATLSSICVPLEQENAQHVSVEIVVVDDGSQDAAALEKVVNSEPRARLLRHEHNQGMIAARNTAIGGSRGAALMILDADDYLLQDWPVKFKTILNEWPPDCQVVFTAAVNIAGVATVADPGYRGRLTFDDMLNERRSGEYTPIFRGDYVRSRKYADIGTRKSCGILSYLRFLEDGPFWITPLVVRVYNDRQPGSITSGWHQPRKARDSVTCIERVLERFGSHYRHRAPRQYHALLLRLAVYRRMARVGGAWDAWIRGCRPTVMIQAVGAFTILVGGGRLASVAVWAGKRLRFLKRYG